MNVPPNTASSLTMQMTDPLLHIGFDYEGVKNLYSQDIKKLIKHRHLSNTFPDRQILNNKILEVKSVTGHKLYDVISFEGEDMLIRKKDIKDNQSTRILSQDDLFDVIVRAHLETNHGSYEEVLSKTSLKYSIPELCLKLLLKHCNVCNKANHIVIEDKAVWHISIDDIKLKNRDYDTFKFILVYEDKNSSYTLIRPLMLKSVDEVSMELFKVFLVFGAPSKLLTPKNLCSFINVVVDRLSALCPWFQCRVQELVTALIMHRKRITLIHKELDEWMKQTGCDKWELGCHIVQWKLNTAITKVCKSKIKKRVSMYYVPYNEFFGPEANVFKYVSNKDIGGYTGYNSELAVSNEIPNTSQSTDDQTAYNLDTNKIFDKQENLYAKCNICDLKVKVQHKCRECSNPIHSDCGIIFKDRIDMFKIICNKTSCKSSATVPKINL